MGFGSESVTVSQPGTLPREQFLVNLEWRQPLNGATMPTTESDRARTQAAQDHCAFLPAGCVVLRGFIR